MKIKWLFQVLKWLMYITYRMAWEFHDFNFMPDVLQIKQNKYILKLAKYLLIKLLKNINFDKGRMSMFYSLTLTKYFLGGWLSVVDRQVVFDEFHECWKINVPLNWSFEWYVASERISAIKNIELNSNSWLLGILHEKT